MSWHVETSIILLGVRRHEPIKWIMQGNVLLSDARAFLHHLTYYSTSSGLVKLAGSIKSERLRAALRTSSSWCDTNLCDPRVMYSPVWCSIWKQIEASNSKVSFLSVITIDLHQVSVLSPCVFALVMEKLTRTIQDQVSRVRLLQMIQF